MFKTAFYTKNIISKLTKLYILYFFLQKIQLRNRKTDFSLTSANKPQSSLDLYLQV